LYVHPLFITNSLFTYLRAWSLVLGLIPLQVGLVWAWEYFGQAL
jgi:hypothetical protein